MDITVRGVKLAEVKSFRISDGSYQLRTLWKDICNHKVKDAGSYNDCYINTIGPIPYGSETRRLTSASVRKIRGDFCRSRSQHMRGTLCSAPNGHTEYPVVRSRQLSSTDQQPHQPNISYTDVWEGSGKTPGREKAQENWHYSITEWRANNTIHHWQGMIACRWRKTLANSICDEGF